MTRASSLKRFCGFSVPMLTTWKESNFKRLVEVPLPQEDSEDVAIVSNRGDKAW